MSTSNTLRCTTSWRSLGVRPTSGWERLHPAVADAPARRALGLRTGQAVFLVERYTEFDGTPLEWRLTTIRRRPLRLRHQLVVCRRDHRRTPAHARVKTAHRPHACNGVFGLSNGPVLLTGTSGLLGHWLTCTVPGDREIVGIVHRRLVPGVPATVRVDLLDGGADPHGCRRVRPSLIVHTAYAKDHD